MLANTIAEIVSQQAQQQPEAIAIMAPERIPLTYGRLYQHIGVIAASLGAFGIKRNDRVAMVLPNGPEMATAFLGVSAVASSAPLNPNYRAAEFDFYLSDLQARALIILDGMRSPAIEVAEARKIPIIRLLPTAHAEAGLFEFSTIKQPTKLKSHFAESEDIALVLHTSGTTSRPKIVPLTHANICTSAQNIQTTFRFEKTDRCLNIMPLFHIHGLIAALTTSLWSGASIVCTPGLDLEQFHPWLEKFRPTWYTAVPTMHQAILTGAQNNTEVITRCPLRFIRSCSAALPPKVMLDLEKTFNVPVIESYGMTEAAHQISSNPLPPKQRKAGTIGIPTGPEVAIMDEAGNLLSQGEKGEIVIQGKNITQGYENNAEANQCSFTNGWFRTGDQGYVDADGYLTICGRLKEIINKGGEKCSPNEIDNVLMEHSAVSQAVTFAIPHPSLGEDIAVAIVLHENAFATKEEIRSFAFERMVDYKVPSQVLFVDAIPKGPTGKLQRIGLAEQLATKLNVDFGEPEDSSVINDSAAILDELENLTDDEARQLLEQTLNSE